MLCALCSRVLRSAAHPAQALLTVACSLSSHSAPALLHILPGPAACNLCPSFLPQMLVGYEVLLLMLVFPEVSAAFDFRLQWAG